MKKNSSKKNSWEGTASENDREFIDFISRYVPEPVTQHDPLSSDEVRLVLPSDVGKTKNQTVHYNRSGYGWGPTTFWIGDEVTTKSGNKGTVLGSIWVHNLVFFTGNTPYAGYYAVKVDFGHYCKYCFFQELEGGRWRRAENS